MYLILNNKKTITISLFTYATFIIIVSHLSFQDTGNGFLKINDKVLHIAEYLLLGILLFRFTSIVLDKYPVQSYYLTFIFGSIFAITDELHQGFVGYFASGIFGGIRTPDLFDFLADTAGISTSILLIYIIKHIKRKNNLEAGTK